MEKLSSNASTEISETGTSIPYRAYLLIENPSKSNNLGPILRCAAAFGVHKVIFVGYDRCSTEGSHGAAKHINIVAFPTFFQAVEFLKGPESEGGCGVASVVGLLGAKANAYNTGGCKVVENEKLNLVCVDDSNAKSENKATTKDVDSLENSPSTKITEYPLSFPIHTSPFKHGNICFSISKKWIGLPIEQARLCDSFVHVPIVSFDEMNNDGDISHHFDRMVDPQSCLSISLHHFCSWANYDERTFEGQKFDVAIITKGREGGEERKQARAEARECAIKDAEDVMKDGEWGSMLESFFNPI